LRGRRLLDRVPAHTQGPRLAGTQLVISDAHTGLKAAIAAVLLGSSWQRSSADITTRRDVPVGHLRRRERTLAA
jgi:Transposase, Mutator family